MPEITLTHERIELFIYILPFMALTVVLMAGGLISPNGFKKTYHAQAGGSRFDMLLKMGIFIVFATMAATLFVEWITA